MKFVTLSCQNSYKDLYTFFKIVQNKLHYYVITGHTAAELIFERVKTNMGLITWKVATDGMIYINNEIYSFFCFT